MKTMENTNNMSKPNSASTSNSNSTSSTSLYITPMNSPSHSINNWSLDSTSLDVSFSCDYIEPSSNLLANSINQNINQSSTEYQTSPLSTSSTIKGPTSTQSNMNDSKPYQSYPAYLSSIRNCNSSLLSSLPPSLPPSSSIPLSSQSSVKESEQLQKIKLIMKYLSDVESDHLKMVHLVNQLGQNIDFKIKLLYPLLSEFFPQKQNAQTQTDLLVNDFMKLEVTSRTCSPNPNSRIPLANNNNNIININNNNNNNNISAPLVRNKNHSLRRTTFFVRQSDEFIDEDQKKELPVVVKQKMYRLPALVKGYLTRRLFQTEKVKEIIKVIKDTAKTLQEFNGVMAHEITDQDIMLHEQMMYQLDSFHRKFYDIFINYSKSEQMLIISRSRTLSLERQFSLNSVLRKEKEKEKEKKKPKLSFAQSLPSSRNNSGLAQRNSSLIANGRNVNSRNSAQRSVKNKERPKSQHGISPAKKKFK